MDKSVYTLCRVINPKVNVIAQLEFELGFCDVAVHHVNRDTTETSPDVTYDQRKN